MKQEIKKIVKNNSFLLKAATQILRFKERMRKPISGNNNVVINKGVLLNVTYDIVGDNNRIEIMTGSLLSDMTIFMRGNNHSLKIGENCYYKGGSIWFDDYHCQVEIGHKTTIESAHLAVTEPNSKIIIGEDCMFSYDIELRTGDSHSIIDTETGKRLNAAQDIIIENHVWIGAHSIVLKGVTIESNTIIGTKSLVTKNVPGNSVAAGIPTKIIRSNATGLRERIYDKQSSC